MSYWAIAIIAYIVLALLTLAPTLVVIFRGVRLNPGGASFKESTEYSEAARQKLLQHYSRMLGTLGFWKQQAEIYKQLHYYSICWTIPSSVMIPFLAQAADQSPHSKWLITIVSAHTAILLAFHKALKVDSNYKAFRQGESEFYDLYRRLLDRPATFGTTEDERLSNYFDSVENIRKYVRNAEVDNLPTVEQVKIQLENEASK